MQYLGIHFVLTHSLIKVQRQDKRRFPTGVYLNRRLSNTVFFLCFLMFFEQPIKLIPQS
jgi:hypothetical protein